MIRRPLKRRLNVGELKLMLSLDQAKRFRGAVLDLGKKAGLTTARTWYALASLEELGLIRARATDDGVDVALTAAGRRVRMAPGPRPDRHRPG